MSTLYPQDFIQQIRTLFGEESEFFLKALDEPAATSVRLNPFKSSSCFADEAPVVWCPQGRYLTQRPEFIFDPLFHAGAYYVQESSSMFLHHVLQQVLSLYDKQVKVLDLCAAPGGKSTLINSLLKPSDLLVANEIIKSRAGVLEENLMKWGQPNVVISNNDPKDFGSLKDFFDIIVIDAPCSGEGLFRRDKHAIDEWSTDNIALCEGRQQRIVAEVMESLKPGGFIIYSTCTYNLAENEQNVKWMMNEWKLRSVDIQHPSEWPVVASLDPDVFAYRFLPHKVQGEGLFMACLQKPKDVEPQKGRPYKRKDKISKQQLDSVRPWLNNHDDFEFVMVGERVHAIPVSLAEPFQQLTHHLYLKNAGIFMGTFANNDLIPSHHLALSNALSQSVQRLDVTKEDAIKYLRKDNLMLDTTMRGWTVLTYRELPIGWVKLLPNRLNNYLPSHLRILKDYTYATQTEKI
ncbi:MAG: hypothetical protein V4590_07660 [Bacteroidota bacterium]